MSTEKTASLGVWTCTALVVGNVVGSGFFLAPAALAVFGSVALIGWVVMSIGALCLGLVFARLSRIVPETGGPYAFARKGFGDFAGFLVAWGYWISIWASLPAIAIAATDYLQVLIPALSGAPISNLAIALALMIGVALLNLMGTKEAGKFQLIVVSIKMIPFLAVSFLGLFWVEWGHFTPINPTKMSFFLALAGTAPFIMFAFSGVESATVPAGEVKNPKRTIAIATIAGTLIAAAIYTFGTMSVMGVMGRVALEQSGAPFADAASLMWGGWAGYVIAAAAVLSSIAALNGWTLVMAQIPLAAARHGLLPQIFADLNRNGVPAKGIVISVSLSVAILVMQASGSKALISVYDFVVRLSTVADMVPYVFCCFVEGIILITLGKRIGYLNPLTYLPIATIAFVFSMFTIYGAGAEAAMWGFLLLLAGLPIYVLIQVRREQQEK
ncbi:Arginine/agmatine antiporter [Roseovarius albus]|uniref:Arginine/agmatine antiporter n=1 Tax=Roseovarius albus TaxID=1247867 RepID=A0A1X6ZI06_9RHOB|nr:amino acid permease [Roseovarius albus]SLN51823.1 Arginine/agmatine antiporter [Roseovarius albus]